MSRKIRKAIKFEESSGNIFADLGLDDSGELYARAQIGVHVFKILKDKKLKQREIAAVLGIAQPDVSHLMNGHFSRFTTDKLLDFLKRLDRKVTIEVSRHHQGEPYQQVTFASQSRHSLSYLIRGSYYCWRAGGGLMGWAWPRLVN